MTPREKFEKEMREIHMRRKQSQPTIPVSGPMTMVLAPRVVGRIEERTPPKPARKKRSS